jgi:RNA polymerase sigma-70 factor (ECF subfamily)
MLTPGEMPPVAAFQTEVNYNRLYRYVLRLVHDTLEAEDLTQEAFLRAHQRQEALRNPQAFTAWLYRIATHVCLDRLRQRLRRAPLEAETTPEDLEALAADGPSLQQVIEQNEMTTCVQGYLAQLADSYRVVILLHDVHGLTNAEMAGLLGETLANVKIRLHRARIRLRTTLQSGCAFAHNEEGVLTCAPKA